jgi:hypothetical protein
MSGPVDIEARHERLHRLGWSIGQSSAFALRPAQQLGKSEESLCDPTQQKSSSLFSSSGS